jgi:hypothetical protein
VSPGRLYHLRSGEFESGFQAAIHLLVHVPSVRKLFLRSDWISRLSEDEHGEFIESLGELFSSSSPAEYKERSSSLGDRFAAQAEGGDVRQALAVFLDNMALGIVPDAAGSHPLDALRMTVSTWRPGGWENRVQSIYDLRTSYDATTRRVATHGFTVDMSSVAECFAGVPTQFVSGVYCDVPPEERAVRLRLPKVFVVSLVWPVSATQCDYESMKIDKDLRLTQEEGGVAFHYQLVATCTELNPGFNQRYVTKVEVDGTWLAGSAPHLAEVVEGRACVLVYRRVKGDCDPWSFPPRVLAFETGNDARHQSFELACAMLWYCRTFRQLLPDVNGLRRFRPDWYGGFLTAMCRAFTTADAHESQRLRVELWNEFRRRDFHSVGGTAGTADILARLLDFVDRAVSGVPLSIAPSSWRAAFETAWRVRDICFGVLQGIKGAAGEGHSAQRQLCD